METGDKRSHTVLAVAVIALMSAQLFWRLGEFPGIHGDEAWVGLFALRLKAYGLFTPHEMNGYTGVLYGWLTQFVLGWFGVSVWSLRLIGAVANPLAWLVLWATVRRAAGHRAGLVWALLAACSGIVVLKSRVAWEVYALQPLLAALVLSASLRLAEGAGRPWALLLFAASLLGVQNHFIFLSLPLALAAAAAFLGARRPEAGLAFLPAALVNLGLCAALFVVKPFLTESGWPAVRAPLVAAFWLSPLVAWAALPYAERRRGELAALLASPRLAAWVPRSRRALFALLAVSLWFHALAFIEIQSGVAVAQRLASLPVPWLVALPLYAWGAAVLWAALTDSWDRLSDGGEGLTPGAALIAALPVVYAAVFVLFRNTSSIRYYIIPCHLMLAALAASWPRRQGLRRPAVRAAAAAGMLGSAAVLGAAATGPVDRPPLRFRVGWHREKSHDFLDKRPLWEAVESRRLCLLRQDESMIDIPLIFRQHERPMPECDRSRSFGVRYCTDCSRPPYFILVE